MGRFCLQKGQTIPFLAGGACPVGIQNLAKHLDRLPRERLMKKIKVCRARKTGEVAAEFKNTESSVVTCQEIIDGLRLPARIPKLEGKTAILG